ncbi:Na+/H+ antiporter subunit G [Sulfitobacter mediterraneus]|jgi:multicomponent K+:H+ antiporter subunit G|uniref:Na+/H+ antiporter subunit G n=1 Tax=Sulfitobacter TaxID=60136 RepID=UPI001932AEFA|nr:MULTISPECIES: Na+/H+ antiporter subunit G [Sulfitobacter]MBM1633606.1 Na+/H+ antiporter subunit G [Sulfitobacter mediterraneus]MBM1641879.1 Na+/H+ antiporter subunit G [Sulfitobacter mediterraneus]MBM1645470.1 Na+/H+ antiporter subunit G [Sulfitobacter mediterraneus]MBM1649998.1 Na+/H+ antiporter subunit G [Sulfitobacter mediterraneus]MBM1653539.1 Na+/H+ antiporter subunit G [Sulfitobacter mediterraneus]
MTLQLIGIYAVGICLLVGAAFALIGTIGLLKFNDSMTRLHAPTKVGTIGIGALLLASMIHSYVFADGSLHELLIMAFLFVTAPISANFIAKVNIHKRTCDTPPSPPKDDMWATLNVPEADREIAKAD